MSMGYPPFYLRGPGLELGFPFGSVGLSGSLVARPTTEPFSFRAIGLGRDGRGGCESLHDCGKIIDDGGHDLDRCRVGDLRRRQERA